MSPLLPHLLVQQQYTTEHTQLLIQNQIMLKIRKELELLNCPRQVRGKNNVFVQLQTIIKLTVCGLLQVSYQTGIRQV